MADVGPALALPLPHPQKWSKGKTREKLANMVLFDDETMARLVDEVPKMKLITISGVSERLKCNGALARTGIKELVSRGLIRAVSIHAAQKIYTRATHVDDTAAAKDA